MGQEARLLVLKSYLTRTERIQERIRGLLSEMNQDQADHVIECIDMLCEFIGEQYEGVFVENTMQKLIEARFWWSECINPEIDFPEQ